MEDCSKTDIFFAEWERMCKRAEKGYRCEFIDRGITARCSCCGEHVRGRIQEAIKIIQNWSDQNPKVTRQDKFLETFPNAVMCHKTILINPCVVEQGYKPSKGCENMGCGACKEEYWLTTIEE